MLELVFSSKIVSKTFKKKNQKGVMSLSEKKIIFITIKNEIKSKLT